MCAHRGGAAFAGTASVKGRPISGRVPCDFRQRSVRVPAEKKYQYHSSKTSSSCRQIAGRFVPALFCAPGFRTQVTRF